MNKAQLKNNIIVDTFSNTKCNIFGTLLAFRDVDKD